MNKNLESGSRDGSHVCYNDINKRHEDLNDHRMGMKKRMDNRAISDAELIKYNDNQDNEDGERVKSKMLSSF